MNGSRSLTAVRGAWGVPLPPLAAASAAAVSAAWRFALVATAGPGGGAVGTGIGCSAGTEPVPRAARVDVDRVDCLASLRDCLLLGPRTGSRSTNTQPTCGTGLPPISRPGSNSQP